MNNSLSRLIDGIVIALERQIIPHIDDTYARGQAFAVMDVLRNMRPRLEWSRAAMLAQVDMQEAALKRVADLCRGQAERPSPWTPPSTASVTLGTEELEARRDQFEDEICGAIKWLAAHRATLDAAVAKTIEETLTNYMREAVKRELALTALPLFAEISRGANA